MLKKQHKAELLGLIQLTLNNNRYNLPMASRLSELYLEVQKIDSDSPRSLRIYTILVMVGSGLIGLALGITVSVVERLLN